MGLQIVGGTQVSVVSYQKGKKTATKELKKLSQVYGTYGNVDANPELAF